MIYDVIHSNKLSRFNFLVNCNLARGWEPIGGVQTYINSQNEAELLQAMVYKEDNEKMNEAIEFTQFINSIK